MASVHLAAKGGGFVFNVGHGVGKGRSNHRLDVMLVQYLLNSIGFTDVVPDGVFGAKTEAAVTSYQKKRKGIGMTPNALNSRVSNTPGPIFAMTGGTVVDGMIDPWKFPAEITAVNIGLYSTGQPIKPSLTLLFLSIDFRRSPEGQVCSNMPNALRQVLMSG